MATQITYSLIYTTHKLFPFIVARLCLLVIKHNMPQTALETKALYPLVNIKYRQQQHTPVPSLTKPHLFGIVHFGRSQDAESPAHSVLDLVPTWAPATGFAARIFNCPDIRLRSPRHLKKVLKTWWELNE